MAVTEKQRHDLMKAMEGALGSEPAETLMNLLPPVGWADVATKSDLDHLRVAGRADLDVFRAELRGELGELRAELRGELGELRAELRGEMGELGAELRGEMGELREALVSQGAALRSEIHEGRLATEALRGDVEKALRQQLWAFASLNAAMLTIALTFARALG